MNFIQLGSNGRIVSMGCGPDEMALGHLGTVIEVAALQGIDPHEDYFDAGQIVRRTPRPSEHHVFDWTTKTWVGDLAGAKAGKKAQIDSERRRRNLLPISHDGKHLDGDVTAQKNLADKLAGVKERARLGIPMEAELRIWRDADNVTHTWSEMQAYQDWLSGYVIALEDRGTRLYVAAWDHKAAIDNLTTLEEVLTYDITQGWPD